MRKKTKKKRGMPLQIDFVTSLTPNECRDVLYDESERFSGDGTQVTILEAEEQFRVERTIAALVICFEGTLTKVVEGTRVKGQISDETLAHIQRRRRNGRALWIVAYFVYVMIMLSIDALGVAAKDEAIIRMILLTVFLPVLRYSPLPKRAPEQLVNWLHKYLYFMPDNSLLEESSEADYEPKYISKTTSRAPGRADFVTALTPAQCRDVLRLESQRFSGVDQQQVVALDGEQKFSIERITRFSLIKSRFEGTLTEVAQGTHVKGQITDSTLARIRLLTYLQVAGSLISLAGFMISFWYLLLGELAMIIPMSLSFVILLILLPSLEPYHVSSKDQMINWLYRYLDSLPEPLLVDNAADHGYGSQAQIEEDSLHAVKPELRDQAHVG